MEDLVVDAAGLGLRTRQGWVYRGVNLTARPGALVGVAGPAGSGRSALLLTVAGRMRPTEGSLAVCGLPVPGRAHEVRSRVAVARVADVIAPEPELRVRDHVRERELLAGHPIDERDETFGSACGLLGFEPEQGAIAGDLDPAEVSLLAVALALMTGPAAVVLDDLDDGVASSVQRELWRRLRAVAAKGVTVIVSTTDPVPARGILDAYAELPGPAADRHPEPADEQDAGGRHARF